jgi:hypothetical protein
MADTGQALNNCAEITDDHEAISFCSVAQPSVVYCGVPRRSEFDALPMEASDGGMRQVLGANLRRVDRHMLTKSLVSNGVTVIFQYWGVAA